MLSRKSYNGLLEAIKKDSTNRQNAYKSLENIGIDASAIINPLEDIIMDVLQLEMEDENEWTSWFVYENNFGARGLVATKDNKPLKILTFNDIYNILIDQPAFMEEEHHKCRYDKEH